MRVVGLFLALLFGLSPAVAQAPVTMLSADTAVEWVHFDLTPGNQIRFAMTVNGRDAVAVLDTGVSYTIASQVFADAIGLKPAAAGRADAIGGSVPLGWAPIETLRLGGLTRTGGRIAIADLKAIATGGSDPVEMLVGSDLLGTHALDIDYDSRRFRLLPSGRLPFVGTSVPLTLAPESGAFLSELSIGQQRFRPVIVDTGDGSSVTLSSEAWGPGRHGATPFTSAYAFGLGGAIETELTVLPHIRLAGLTARNVEVRVEGKDGFSAQTGTAGRIGSGLLQRYRVLIDPGARRMVLAPGKTVDRTPLKSTSGLLIAHEGHALRVLHVMRNSPAEAAGWRAGERICAIDGAALPPDYLTSSVAAWPAGNPGRTVRLGLCDNGGDRTLTLARFY
ncbi:aspartyl protease family protein [Sphingomonas sp.]|uniref:aspartyl protease family protein n=1 Tax=Sphingomonas sp. TaxID=28214 RepID=UPI002B7ABBB9|nr:aspartyl protease family protein [Sphingomonas sp.]HWK35670.1 aspartyl protease family protein [Sphingomonas sp.]